LCWKCFYQPSIRAQYPSTSKFARRGEGIGCIQAPLPAFPTTAMPGTPAKITVLAERARLKQSLWHPEDATDVSPASSVPRAG